MAQAAAENGAPQWYCRILKLRGSTFSTSEDYDKDLLELRDEDLDDEYPDCKCDEQDIDCYCDELWEPDESKSRNRKYTGPDAAHLYEVKADRSLRKHDVRDVRLKKESEKQERLKLDRDKENKVLEVLKELTESGGDNDQPAGFDLLMNRHFDLYCSDFTELWWDDYFPTAYIEFYDLSKETTLGVPIS
ncbi:uncharacterized protein FIESC28_10301 [Fusarium coffeatum]|uniref:Uncharacterized protein n=1 Tax=Fusarium coffeatum TaxID=231269 RepID=A0A366QTT6_9HYPO|nr:uncharacterized protein FIESC28_10301 [Fusarium coffeatum]RBR08267.1 hypothetical protein FIESC28_10301 [Fusarium coffeatum]